MMTKSRAIGYLFRKRPSRILQKSKKKNNKRNPEPSTAFREILFRLLNACKDLKTTQKKIFKACLWTVFFFVCAMVKAKNIKAAKMYTINVFKIDVSVFFSFHKHDLSSYLAVYYLLDNTDMMLLSQRPFRDVYATLIFHRKFPPRR